ncbi:hypothetical protein [Winogradskyella sp. UBA3174]|uniref:hypothetical protein n=1 Tax=Winogradskyella sp. UBA3174 TaxID=1947785 RepID=UPI0025DA6E25|nr:hypothetical protein [Winogradskyella sp. UBA3174]|tara:strand:- start:31096 stop:31434 length:339 start_codon:yes stop_codon:yes gene_type:complete
MNFTIIFIIIITTLIIFKVRDISQRNDLNIKEEKRLLITGGLFILFFITNITLPYPQSLYWFIFLGIVIIASVLSFNVIKKELKRFKLLKTKDVLLNLCFYSLFFIVMHLYI